MTRALVIAGIRCANCCYNVAQLDELGDRERVVMRESCAAWDSALREVGEEALTVWHAPTGRRRR